MMTKDINKSPYDVATLTKLEIFEQYMAAWLPVFILSPYTKELMICDFFAGSGQDSNGVPGSPLRILRQLESFSDQILQNRTTVHLVLNESDAKKAQLLQDTVDGTGAIKALGKQVSLSCRSADFQKLFRLLYAQLQHQPNLLFIDQYGVKHVTGEVFEMLITLEKTDFLFFISSSAMKRFARTPEFAGYFPDFDSSTITGTRIEDVHRVMLDYYKSKIPPGNPTRLYPFTLKKGSNIYGLIFGSEHPLGVEKFLDLAWDKNKLNGEANFDIDDDITKRQPMLFSEYQQHTKREAFDERLEEFISEQGKTTNEAIYRFTLAQGHPKSHARECVRKLRAQNKVEYSGAIGFSYDACVKKKRLVTIRARTNG